MKTTLFILYLTTLLVFTLGQKQCFSNKPTISQAQNISSQSGPLKLSLIDPIKDFQTGSYSIMNTLASQKQQRYTCFNITLLYINTKNSYQVVASIQNIQNYQDTQGLDFSIRFSPNQAIIQGLFIMSETAQWSSVSIHYVISSREDFRVGTFVPEMIQFLPCGRQSEDLVISHRLVKSWNASAELVFGLPFLSGLRTIDTQLNITFGKSAFHSNTSVLQIPVTFAQVQFPIEYMLISYFIVTMSSDFQIANIYDLSYIPSDINVFVGMTGVKLAPQQSSVLKSALSVTSKSRFEQFFSVQGLVIQSTSNLDILFSDGNYQSQQVIECISAEKCQGYDGYMKYYQNQNGFMFHSQCVLCQKFASYNNLTLKCQCRELYVRVNGECVAKGEVCGESQVYDEKTGKCSCGDGWVLRSDGVCVACPAGYTSFKGNCYKLTKATTDTNLTNTTVINKTSQTSTTNTTNITNASTIIQPQCPFPSTYNDTLNACQCSSPLYFSQTQRKCLSCGQNQVYSTKTKQCQCMNGSFKINEACDFCSQHGFFNGTGCQCLPGYLGNGKICREDVKFAINVTLARSAPSDGGDVSNNATATIDNATTTDSNTINSTSNNLTKDIAPQANLSQPIVLGTINL